IGYVSDRGYISRNQEGKPLRLIGATQDITERKNAEQKILLREQRFRALVQNGFDLIGVIDKEGNYTHSGGSRKKVLGYDSASLAGTTPFSFIHPDDSGAIKKALSDLQINKHLQLAPYRYKHANGEWRWMETSLTNLLDHPEIHGIIANSRDVTERKNIEDELKKLSLVARETINGVVIRDKHQNIVWVNSAFTKLFGYELNEVIGKNPLDFLPGPETDINVINYIKKKSITKDPFSFEILYYSKTGNKIYLRIQVQPILDDNGELVQSFSIQNDITTEKVLKEKAELEKIIKQKQITDAVFTAQEIERSEIGRELHDNVNQLLGATCLYIGMAKKDEENRDSLLTSASTFALDAIEEIRKLSKTLITPLIKEIGLADSIKYLSEEIVLVHSVKILLTTDNFLEEGLSYKFKLNIFRIIQVAINNIIQHAQAKNIFINMEDNSNELLISITDDGIGFDTNKRKSGIGITNIKSRSALYNGKVALTSKKGKGTILSLTFNKANLQLNTDTSVDP
ncbi:MAG: PAS domain S-box protein, partial [Chitinophagaceae bacterium]|nr:PAS domain S-box protein [Chitinophagaceae bacterium]